MRILSIETSCDETGIAIIESRGIERPTFVLRSHALASQVKIHKKWGGVVPNLAAREHQRNLVPILKMALSEAKLLTKNPKSRILNPKKNRNAKSETLNGILEREPVLLKEVTKFLKQYEMPNIDAIAVTVGPGLAPALWIGVNFAKALAYFWDKPIIPVNHMEGHIFSNFIENPKSFAKVTFPALCLLVSGGHTQLVLINDVGKYKIIGETLDDAAGEAFDKVAIMLGLGYPGGPVVSKLAKRGNFKAFDFPRPMMKHKNFNFSFSGLKTAVLYTLRDLQAKTYNLKPITSDICASFEQAVVDILVAKTIRAAHEYNVKDILLAGGVSANKKLRGALAKEVKKHLPHATFWKPTIEFSGDNGAMIAAAAHFEYRKNPNITVPWKKIEANANLRL